MNCLEALKVVQSKLNAPKGRKNSFGGYNYRSCEDICNAVKPLLAEVNASVTLTDDIVMVGERIYVKATAVFKAGDESVVVTAFAREEKEKKGMDAAQVTGAASSYARKYALNGLFLIDDVKDPDTDEYTSRTQKGTAKATPKKADDVDSELVVELCQQILTCNSVDDIHAIYDPYKNTPYAKYLTSTCNKRHAELKMQGLA